MSRTNQRGSILEFIIIGGLMALLLVGGAYLVRRTLVPADSSDEPIISQSDSGDGATEPQDDETDESAVDSEEQSAQDASENQPEDEPSEQQATGSSEGQGSTPQDLPQTGPADTLISGFLLGGVVAAGAAYKRSRDALTSL